MGAAGGYMSIASGLVNAVGTLHQTQAELQNQAYQEKLASRDYHLAKQAGAAVASDIRSESGAVVSKQAATTKAGGVTLEGTPLQVMADTAAAGELTAQRALYRSHIAATSAADQKNMAAFNKYFLKWNKFNRAGSAFVSSFANSGGMTNAMNMGSGGSSLLS